MLKLLIFTIFAIRMSNCNENLIQINFKKAVNEISDKFVSFSVDPKYLLNGHYARYLSNSTEDIFDSLGPAYIRLNMSPELKFHDGNTLEEEVDVNRVRQIEFGIQEWKSLHKWTEQHNFVAVIQLEYDSTTWKARDTLRLLGVANDIGIKNCVWQLGTELNATGIKKYVEDFKAFETMVKVFPEEKTNWKVIPANVKDDLSTYDTSFFYNEVKDIIYSAVWQQEFQHPTNPSLLAPKDTSLKYLLKHESNMWLNIIYRRNPWSSNAQCGTQCTQDGLQWARILGDASRKGFKAVFKPLVKRDFAFPGFQHHITRLFKHLIGSKVFGVTALKVDRTSSGYYAFCGRNQTGGFVLMMVNSGENRLKTEFNLAMRHKKSVVRKYVLSICDGEVCLNDKKFGIDSEITPISKKKNFKRSIILSVPAESVTFYEFPLANVGHCMPAASDEVDDDESYEQKRSSAVSRILKDLAIENLNHEKRHYDVILPRIKRQIIKDFNFFKPLTPPQPPKPKKHPTPFNNGKILHSNKLDHKTKIPGMDQTSSIEEEIFQSRENMDLPRGEMYLFVGADSSIQDPDYDYVEFDEKSSKSSKKSKKPKTKQTDLEMESPEEQLLDEGGPEKSVEVESIDEFPHDFGGEFVRPASRKQKTKVEDREIYEMAATKTRTGYKTKKMSKKDQEQNDKNTQYAVLVKELAPTVRQNRLQRKKMDRKLAKMSNGALETSENDQNHEEQEQEETDDYEYFNEDDDRFFRSDEEDVGDKKKRNSAHANLVDSNDKKENQRFMKAFEKLLQKIEKKVVENSESSTKDNAVRTRRSIASVHIPKRKTRKSLRFTETGKEISKATPIDIKSIAKRPLNELTRKKRFLEDPKTNFYEVTNEIDVDDGDEEPKIFVKQLKHFHIEPSTNDFNISAEFMLRPKMFEKEEVTASTPTTTTDSNEIPTIFYAETDFTTSEISPIETNTEQNFPIKVASVFDSIVKPFVDFYNTLVRGSQDLLDSVFPSENEESEENY